MTFEEAAKELKTTHSKQIFSHYGYDTTNRKYTALEPLYHKNADKTPSMSLHNNGDKYYLKDFAGEQKMYSSLDSIMVVDGVGYADAVRKGAEIVGITIEEKQEQLSKVKRFVVSGLYARAKREGFAVKEIVSISHYPYNGIDGIKLYDKYRIDFKKENEIQDKHIHMGVEENGFIRKFKPGEYQNAISMYGDFRKYEPGETVIIPEGEKCVDACHSSGMKNVVTVGSSSDFKSKGKKLAKYFNGTNIVILQDNDKPGEKLTKDIITAFQHMAASIKVIIPDTSRTGADIADFFENGGTLEKLQKMIDNTEPVQTNTASGSVDQDEDKLKKFHHFNKEGVPTGAFDYEIFRDIIENYSIFVHGFPYIYEDGVYRADYNGTKTKQIIRRYLYKQFIKSRIINQIYNLIVDAEELQRSFQDINNYPKHYINFEDCMLDVKTMQKIPHSPDFYAINQIPFRYEDVEKASEGQEIEKFFDFIFPNADDRQMLLEYAGLCLTTDTSQQRFLTLCGLGGTGKSVLIRLLESATGIDNVSNVSMQELSKRFSTSLLVGKTLNSCADLSVEALEDSSTVKKLLGEDMIFAERKGQDGFMFRNYAKLLFSTNMLPVITAERTNGFYRRLLILKMDRQPEKPDVGLADRLIKEIPYFIKLAIAALHEMYDRGIITISEGSKQAVLQMRKDSDVVESWLNDCCTIKAGEKTERGAAYTNFKKYCDDEERTSLTRNGFFKALRTKNYKEAKGRNDRYFVGFVLKNCRKDENKTADFMQVTDEELKNLPFI